MSESEKMENYRKGKGQRKREVRQEREDMREWRKREREGKQKS